MGIDFQKLIQSLPVAPIVPSNWLLLVDEAMLKTSATSAAVAVGSHSMNMAEGEPVVTSKPRRMYQLWSL